MILRLSAAICVGSFLVAYSPSSIAQSGDQTTNKLNATAGGAGVTGIGSSQHYSRNLTAPKQDFSYLACRVGGGAQ
jgi:hypothetical protein